MRIGEFLQQKRLEKGYSDVELAKIMGITIDSYCDLEFYDDEISILSIQKLKKLSDILGITPIKIFDVVISDLKELELSKIINKRREEKGLTIEETADLIGYEPNVIEKIEKNEDLDNLSIGVLIELACALDLPFKFILSKI